MVNRTERGWAGHFICANNCKFRRNTLLENGKKRIVVSTVGAYMVNGKLESIGSNGRYYETMAFKAKKIGMYFDADVSEELSFESEWAICADSPLGLPDDVDNRADQQHEMVVAEMIARLDKSENKQKGKA